MLTGSKKRAFAAAARLSEGLERLERGQADQGGRIGRLESGQAGTESLLTRIEAAVSALSAKIDALEKEPGAKWKAMTANIVSLVLTAVVTGVIMRVK